MLSIKWWDSRPNLMSLTFVISAAYFTKWLKCLNFQRGHNFKLNSTLKQVSIHKTQEMAY